MDWQNLPYAIPLVLGGGIAAGIAYYVWRNRTGVGAISFAVLMTLVSGWSVGYACDLLCTVPSLKSLFYKIHFPLGAAGVPVAWLAFALGYTGHGKWLKRRNVILLSLIPGLVVIACWTNEWHHWFKILSPGPGDLLTQVTYAPGPVFGVHVVYSYTLMLVGTYLFLRALVYSPHIYRGQVVFVLFGVLVPLAANIVSLWGSLTGEPFRLGSLSLDFSWLDPTPYAFILSGLAMGWALYRYRLLDIVPVARSAVVDGMSDAVFVLDTSGRVVDINPAARGMLATATENVLGETIDQVFAHEPALARQYREDKEIQGEVTLKPGRRQRHYEVRTLPLCDHRDQPIGRLIVFHDVTVRKKTEADLQAQKKLFESLVAMARAVAKHPSLEATLQNALNMSARLTRAENGSLFLLDGEEVVTHSALARARPTQLEEQKLVRKVMKEGLAGWVVRHRSPTLISDTTLDDRWVPLPDAPYSTRSALAMPIVSGSAVLGVLTLMHSQPNHFQNEHAVLIQSAADQIMLALRNAQMYDGQRRLAARQTTLYRTLRAVGMHLDPQAIASAAVETIAELTRWPAVSILVPDTTQQDLTICQGAGPLFGSETDCMSIDQGITGRAFRQAETQYASDVHDDPDYVEEHPALQSELVVPIRRGDRVMGVLDLASDRLGAFDEDDILLAESLAEAIALALDNARLYAETRQYAEAIADERGRLQALIETSRDGTVFIGMDQSILVINAPAFNFLQLPGKPDDWVGRSIAQVLLALRHHAPDTARLTLTELRRFTRGDLTPGEGEVEVGARTIRWLNLPVITGDTSLGQLLVLHDITEERLLENMREDLTHTMVHDLRNPLTAIYGALALLDKRIGADLIAGQQQLWDIARANTSRMLDMVNAILDISRLESQQMPLEYGLISLADLVTSVLRSQMPLAADKGLQLNNQVPATLPPLWADRALIERVVRNLVGNAIKFTPSGSVQVMARQDPESSRVLVSVTDTGSGIPPEVQPRLFQKFVTGEGQGVHGSGLGLAFCKMVLEAHGERIWLAHTSEEGTTFTFSLSPPKEIEMLSTSSQAA